MTPSYGALVPYDRMVTRVAPSALTHGLQTFMSFDKEMHMRLTSHLVAAIPFSSGIFLTTGSLTAAALAAASSVLIDVDHLPDYVYHRGCWRGIQDFFDTCNGCRLVRTFLVFHSWEWLIVWGLLSVGGLPAGFLWPVAAGMVYHLALDTASNAVRPSFYWFSCRALRGFKLSRFSDVKKSLNPAPTICANAPSSK